MKNQTTRRNKSEMYPMIELYRESRMKQTEFCAEMNMTPHVFQYWLGKYKKETALKSKFIDIAIQADSQKEFEIKSPQADRMLRVHYPNGQLIEIPV